MDTGAPVDTIHRHFVKWIEQILRAKDWTASDLARAAGMSPSTITRRMKGEVDFAPTFATIKKLEKAGGIEVPAALMLLGQETGSPSRNSAFYGMGAQAKPRRPLKAINADREVECPAYLDGDDRSVAVEIADDWMEPAYQPGNIVYGTSRHYPLPGDQIVVVLKSGEAMARMLVEVTRTGLVVGDLLGKRKEPVDRAEVEAVLYLAGSMRV